MSTASPHTSRLSFVTEVGAPLDAPREWVPARVLLDCPVDQWPLATLRRNGVELPIHVRKLDGRPSVVADWPCAGAGDYELSLVWEDGSWQEVRACRVAPGKISAAELDQMLSELEHRLPASIAIALQRGGALAGIDIIAPDETTLAEEIQRLTRAIDGTRTRAGLATILSLLSQSPYTVLKTEEQWVDRVHARRLDGPGMVRALQRPGNLDEALRPRLVPTRPPVPSADVYENHLLRTYHDQVALRLRALTRKLGRTASDGLKAEAADLRRRLVAARQAATFLDDVAPLAGPPTEITMVLLRRTEYRAALKGLLELRRRAMVHLRQSPASAPLAAMPFLYETWGVLEVIAATLEVAVTNGYHVTHQSLASRSHGEIYVQLLRNGSPAVQATHPATGAELTVTPQRRYDSGRGRGNRLHSVSFPEIPDVAVELTIGARTDVHIFDPKYKLQSEGLADEPPTGRPKKTDIDAMHAYRDAIRDAGGRHAVRYAAILYPGPSASYGEGLAAISARPGSPQALREQLRGVLGPALERAASPRPVSVRGVSERTILHITTDAGWAAAEAEGELVSPSLAAEGFIHCSTFAQLETTANRIFKGSGDLLLLEVDIDALTAPLRWERATDVSEEFPHIYGPLNLEAVVGTQPLPEGPGGYALDA